MTTAQPRSVEGTEWRRHLARRGRLRGRSGSVVHLASPFLPVQLAMVGLGIGLIGAAFMLAWAADAGEAVFSGGLVLAVVALVTVLPEFVIEIRFAFIQAGRARHRQPDRCDPAPADGCDRAAAARRLLARRRGQDGATAPARRQPTARARDPADHVDLRHPDRGPGEPDDLRRGHPPRALRPLRAARAGHAGRGACRRRGGRRPPVAPAAVPTARDHGADRRRRRRRHRRSRTRSPTRSSQTGTSLGIDPYLLIQSVVPAATEAPEFVVVAVLVVNHRPAQGLALFLASSVSQWTLGLGSLPDRLPGRRRGHRPCRSPLASSWSWASPSR